MKTTAQLEAACAVRVAKMLPEVLGSVMREIRFAGAFNEGVNTLKAVPA